MRPADGQNSFEFYGEPQGGRHQASEAIGSFATRQRARQPHHRIPQHAIEQFHDCRKGLPTREPSKTAAGKRAAPHAMLAAITDPLTVALGGAKQLPNQASQWQGWSVTDLRTDGGWRRSSLVVNGDGLGSDEVALSYACEYEGQATQGAAVRSRAQLLRLHATLVHDAPGSLVPPLTLENEQGVDAFAQGLLRHGRLRRCRAAVAFLVDLEGFEKIASELLELGEEVAPLGPRLALHEATRDKHANIDADETAAVIADILEWRRGQDDALLEARRRVEVLQRSEGDLSTAWQAVLACVEIKFRPCSSTKVSRHRR